MTLPKLKKATLDHDITQLKQAIHAMESRLNQRMNERLDEGMDAMLKAVPKQLPEAQASDTYKDDIEALKKMMVSMQETMIELAGMIDKEEVTQVIEQPDVSSEVQGLSLELKALKEEVTQVIEQPDVSSEVQGLSLELKALKEEVTQVIEQPDVSSEALHIFEQNQINELVAKGNYTLANGIDGLSDQLILLRVDDFSHAHDVRVLQYAFATKTEALFMRSLSKGNWAGWEELKHGIT